MKQAFQDIYNKICEYDNIIIHRHVRADGDAIGSSTGLKYAIKETFPNKNVYVVGEKAPDYLSGIAEYDDVPDELYKESLVIVVDTSNADRVSDERFKNGKFIIKIDHHDDSPDFADINYVEPETPACASIVTELIRSTDLKMSKKAAFYLYYGIVSDTGRFRYRGVNKDVFTNASYLLEYDVDIQSIYDSMYVDTIDVLKLQGYVYSHFKTTPNGVSYIYFSKKVMKKFGVTKEDAGNLVNTLGGIKGSLIWVAFIEQMLPKGTDPKNGMPMEKETRARVRSRHIAINEIAGKYRGGGHLNAAGATVYSKKEAMSLINDLDTALCTYKKEHPDAY